jgi:hypothetical protein
MPRKLLDVTPVRELGWHHGSLAQAGSVRPSRTISHRSRPEPTRLRCHSVPGYAL